MNKQDKPKEKLTIFYDGLCPLCMKEMRQLNEYDHNGYLKLIDIQAKGFTKAYPQIDPNAASKILHALEADGRLLLGLDVTCRAWQLVGKHRWLKVLRWPVIKFFADKCYLFFANNRYRISFLLTGQARCGSCEQLDYPQGRKDKI